MYSLDSYFSNADNEKHCLSLPKSFEIDEVAKSLMPSDMIPNIVPVVRVRDGSYSYNTIFMILTGNCQLKCELRLKTVKELISNWNVYDNEELNLYGAWDSFEEEVLESVKMGTYSSLMHMYSLFSLLGCKIVLIYPNTIKPCINRNFFNKNIFLIENKFLNTVLPIMWTNMTNVKLAGWSHLIFLYHV